MLNMQIDSIFLTFNYFYMDRSEAIQIIKTHLIEHYEKVENFGMLFLVSGQKSNTAGIGDAYIVKICHKNGYSFQVLAQDAPGQYRFYGREDRCRLLQKHYSAGAMYRRIYESSYICSVTFELCKGQKPFTLQSFAKLII